MDEQDPITSEPRSSEQETPTAARGASPATSGSRLGSKSQPSETNAEPQRLKIVLRVEPVESQDSEPPKAIANVAAEPASIPLTATEPVATSPTVEANVEHREGEPQPIPA